MANGEQERRPTIFFIEEDDQTRRMMVTNLRSQGYRVIVAIDEEDALERVGDGHARADLVLVDLCGKSAEECLRVGHRVREHAKYDGQTPLVATPERYDKDVEGTDVHAGGNDWIMYLGEEPDQLKNLLANLLRRAP